MPLGGAAGRHDEVSNPFDVVNVKREVGEPELVERATGRWTTGRPLASVLDELEVESVATDDLDDKRTAPCL